MTSPTVFKFERRRPVGFGTNRSNLNDCVATRRRLALITRSKLDDVADGARKGVSRRFSSSSMPLLECFQVIHQCLHAFERPHLAAVKTLNSVLFPVKYHVRMGTWASAASGVHRAAEHAVAVCPHRSGCTRTP